MSLTQAFAFLQRSICLSVPIDNRILELVGGQGDPILSQFLGELAHLYTKPRVTPRSHEKQQHTGVGRRRTSLSGSVFCSDGSQRQSSRLSHGGSSSCHGSALDEKTSFIGTILKKRGTRHGNLRTSKSAAELRPICHGSCELRHAKDREKTAILRPARWRQPSSLRHRPKKRHAQIKP